MPLVARILLTYLVHSSLLLGAAALACAVLRERRLALQEALLRAALVGGLVTSALQIGLGLEPIGGRLSLPISTPAVASPLRERQLPVAVPLPATPSAGATSPWPTGGVIGTAAFPGTTTARWEAWPAALLGARRVARAWRTVLAIGWAAAALLGLARLVVAAARLRHLLEGRSRIAGDTLAAEASAVAATLGIRRSVRLSAAPRLVVPLATGLLRPEVCLPTRALSEMDGDEQVALCAHELAHLARRDPAWILLARTIEALAPVQPLNTWARRRLQDLAECLSDDLAVSASARPLGLVRSLVDVASWTIGEPLLLPVTVAGALDRRSRLGHRVERLMDPVRAPERPNRCFLPAAAAVVLASALVTPVVAGSSSPGGSEKPVAATAPASPENRPAPPAEPPAAPGAPAAVEAPPAPAEPPLPNAEPLPAVDPLPTADPVPAVEPTPSAKPAPRPKQRPAPHARARVEADGLDALAGKIESRVRRHESELSELEAQIEALAERLMPSEAELERLGEEMGKAGEDLAQAVLGEADGKRSARASAAAHRMAELETKLRALTSELRIPADEIRALAEKSRALAEKARPTDEELRELRRLSLEAAREATPDREELARMHREAREQAHAASQQAHEAARKAREAMRRAEQELRRAREEMRRAHEEARREHEKAQGEHEQAPGEHEQEGRDRQ